MEVATPDAGPVEQARPLALDRAGFYGPLGALVDEFAGGSDAPPEAVALNFLVHFAARFGNLALVDIDGKLQTPTLYGIVIGPTVTGRKSFIADEVMSIYEEVDRFAASFVTIRDSASLIATPRELTGSPTAEGIIGRISGDERRLLIRLDPFAELAHSSERTGNNVLHVLHKAFDGQPISTGARYGVTVENAHICALGNLSPEEFLSERISKGLNGFGFSRFLAVYSEAPQGRPTFERMHAERRDYLARFVLAHVAGLLDGRPAPANGSPVFVFELTPEAAAMWAGLGSLPFLRRFESPMASRQAMRLGVILRRLAALLALANGERVITAQVVTAAQAWGLYACRVLDYLHTPRRHADTPPSPLALRMLGRVVRLGGPVQAADLLRWARRHHTTTTAQASEALAELVERQAVSCEPCGMSAKGGRPGRVVAALPYGLLMVNPMR